MSKWMKMPLKFCANTRQNVKFNIGRFAVQFAPKNISTLVLHYLLTKLMKKQTGMAGQSVIPGTNKQEATENVLEGPFSFTRSKAHGVFELQGNILGSIGAMKLPAGEPPSNEVVRVTNKPLIKILTGAFNIIRIPRAPTDSRALLGNIEEQKMKRSESLGQTCLEGIEIFLDAGFVFMVCMLTVKIMICTGGPSSLKDSTTDLLSFSEDRAKGGSEASGLPLL
ncbi:hypothetical protein X943_000880 [Babesia divergens]|uniref:Uncharacterized protein n=1 Tax=Babesia divergens TaxID=32595 RepID=A0AAD9LKI2_BABDI|nr:hypothetical protein X943_000880 [Babesia divergens]